MAQLKLKIVTPERIVYQEMVDGVVLPTALGEITVLPRHIPLVAVLMAGELLIKKDNQEISMAVSGGLIEVKKNELVVLADTAEHAHEIDIQRAEEAKKRAEELMKNKEAVDTATLAASLNKELARLKVAKKHKTRQVFIANK
jgi:F-type H+-transporting ATPase subunit epsilon